MTFFNHVATLNAVSKPEPEPGASGEGASIPSAAKRREASPALCPDTVSHTSEATGDFRPFLGVLKN